MARSIPPRLLTSSRVREYVKTKKMKTSAAALEQLNIEVLRVINDAIKRAELNKRTVLQPRDF